MAYVMQPYDDALSEILENGVVRHNQRTGIKTRSIFGMQRRYRIDEHFPIVTRRKVWPKSIFAELLWFISGSTNNKDLQALGSNIWTPWVDPEFEKKNGYVEGALGPVYGFQLRHFGGNYGNGGGGFNNLMRDLLGGGEDHVVSDHRPYPTKMNYYGSGGKDQLAYMMKLIKEDPSNRRILFSLWNPGQISVMRLPPCHYTYQVFIDDQGRMSGMLTQRSADYPIGVPANIQFYSAFTHMLAQQTGYKAYEFIHSTADSHIYEDQIPAVKEYLASPVLDSPKMILKKAENIESYKVEDFELIDFKTGPKITIPVAV